MASGNSAEHQGGSRLNVLAAAWGAAEATLFFIVPDVLLSRIALHDRRRALIACLWALGGALLGGALIWALGSGDPEPVRSTFARIPAVSPAMIERVQAQLASHGPWSLFIGPLTGTPYKIYALEAAGAGIGLLAFLLISIPARLLRFVLVVFLTAAIARACRDRLGLRTLQVWHAGAWIAFYAGYFYAMSLP